MLYIEKSIISKVVFNIASKVNKYSFQTQSLYGGLAGRILFSYYYGTYFNDKKANLIIEDELNYLVEGVNEMNSYTFCSGRAGINWLFSFLHKRGVLYEDDKKILCDDYDAVLKAVSSNLIRSGHYDVLHGSMGIHYYLLYSSPTSMFKESYFSDYTDAVAALQKDSPFGKFIPNIALSQENKMSEINLGLSHGMPSILKVLLEGYKNKIAAQHSKEIIYNVIDCIICCMNDDRTISYFPSVRNILFTKSSNTSRLAWCYGDLGTAYILLQAGIILSDKAVESLALEILINTTKRKNMKEAGLVDFGICHGVAGVAYIYYKLWKITKLPIFRQANEYWMSQLLLPASKSNFSSYYEKYLPSEQQSQPSYSLLEGAVGIGMVLLSYVTGDTDWDYCLMLNDSK